MGYEILSNELFQEEDEDRSKKKRPQIHDELDRRVPSSRPRRESRDDEMPKDKIPFIIQITLAIVVIIIIGYFIITFFDGSSKVEREELQILGGLDSFEYDYEGDLIIVANKFEITSRAGKFNDVNKEILIEDFNGHMKLVNKTIVVEGISSAIEYGGNKLNLEGTEFKLTSENKVEFEMYFDNLFLNMSEAGIRFDKSLSYDFEESFIEIYGFNSTIIYDGTFSIIGYPDEFNLLSVSDGIFVSYVE